MNFVSRHMKKAGISEARLLQEREREREKKDEALLKLHDILKL